MLFKSQRNGRVKVKAAACGACFVLALTVVAADKAVPLDVKLGLWQMTYTLDANGSSAALGIPPELLAKMTPEQRARTEAKLRARAAQGPILDTKRYCLTQERLDQAQFSRDESKACQRTMTASTAKLQQFHEECDEGGTKRVADARFEALDGKTMKGTVQVKAAGKATLTSNTEIAGKWIGTDCGDEARR
jgi:hypothetical protein